MSKRAFAPGDCVRTTDLGSMALAAEPSAKKIKLNIPPPSGTDLDSIPLPPSPPHISDNCEPSSEQTPTSDIFKSVQSDSVENNSSGVKISTSSKEVDGQGETKKPMPSELKNAPKQISWASNYLASIGTYKKQIKFNLSSSRQKFQLPTETVTSDVESSISNIPSNAKSESDVKKKPDLSLIRTIEVLDHKNNEEPDLSPIRTIEVLDHKNNEERNIIINNSNDISNPLMDVQNYQEMSTAKYSLHSNYATNFYDKNSAPKHYGSRDDKSYHDKVEEFLAKINHDPKTKYKQSRLEMKRRSLSPKHPNEYSDISDDDNLHFIKKYDQHIEELSRNVNSRYSNEKYYYRSRNSKEYYDYERENRNRPGASHRHLIDNRDREPIHYRDTHYHDKYQSKSPDQSYRYRETIRRNREASPCEYKGKSRKEYKERLASSNRSDEDLPSSDLNQKTVIEKECKDGAKNNNRENKAYQSRRSTSKKRENKSVDSIGSNSSERTQSNKRKVRKRERSNSTTDTESSQENAYNNVKMPNIFISAKLDTQKSRSRSREKSKPKDKMTRTHEIMKKEKSNSREGSNNKDNIKEKTIRKGEPVKRKKINSSCESDKIREKTTSQDRSRNARAKNNNGIRNKSPSKKQEHKTKQDEKLQKSKDSPKSTDSKTYHEIKEIIKEKIKTELMRSKKIKYSEKDEGKSKQNNKSETSAIEIARLEDLTSKENEDKRHVPIKSVIHVRDEFEGQQYMKDTNEFDLREKLKSKGLTHYFSKLHNRNMYTENIALPRDNLRITVANQNDPYKIPTSCEKPEEKKQIKKNKTNKYKKIKLIIKVACESSDSDNDSSETDTSNNKYSMGTEDLSFLDDLNIDEIVNSLTSKQTDFQVSEKSRKSRELKNKKVEHSLSLSDGEDSDASTVHLEEFPATYKDLGDEAAEIDTKADKECSEAENNGTFQNQEADIIENSDESDTPLTKINITINPDTKYTTEKAAQHSKLPTKEIKPEIVDEILIATEVEKNTKENRTNVIPESQIKKELDEECGSLNQAVNNENNIIPEKDIKVEGSEKDSVNITVNLNEISVTEDDNNKNNVENNNISFNIKKELIDDSQNKEDSLLSDTFNNIIKNKEDLIDERDIKKEIPPSMNIIGIVKTKSKDSSSAYQNVKVNITIDLTDDLSDVEVTDITEVLNNEDHQTNHEKSDNIPETKCRNKSSPKNIDDDIQGISIVCSGGDSQLQTGTKESALQIQAVRDCPTSSLNTMIDTIEKSATDIEIKTNTLRDADDKDKPMLDNQLNNTVPTKVSEDNLKLKDVVNESSPKLNTSVSKDIFVSSFMSVKQVNNDLLSRVSEEILLSKDSIIPLNIAKTNETVEITYTETEPNKSELKYTNLDKAESETSVKNPALPTVSKNKLESNNNKSKINNDPALNAAKNITKKVETKELNNVSNEPLTFNKGRLLTKARNDIATAKDSHGKDATKNVSDPIRATSSNNAKTPISTTLSSGKNFVSKFQATLSDQYRIEAILHRGQFSEIYHCVSRKGENYVLKTRNVKTMQYKRSILEIIKRKLKEDNPHFVRLFSSFSMTGQYCQIMEYFPKNLSQLLEEDSTPFRINVLQHLSKQLVSAVMFLGCHRIIHTDINPSHVLVNISNDSLKLCGFDNALFTDKKQLLPSVGMAPRTVNYRAPEDILGYATTGYAADVWATALVMYEMATRRQLFPGPHNNDILFKQMCTLGYVPEDMIGQSIYSHKHFNGYCFMRRCGKSYVYIQSHQLYKNNILRHTVKNTYKLSLATAWGKSVTRKDRVMIYELLSKFCDLLEQMLTIHPYNRLPIEFVNANNFFQLECSGV